MTPAETPLMLRGDRWVLLDEGYTEPGGDEPDPDVCAACGHQRVGHDPCWGIDCDCGEFIEPAT